MVPPGIPNTTLAPAASSDRTIDCAPVIDSPCPTPLRATSPGVTVAAGAAPSARWPVDRPLAVPDACPGPSLTPGDSGWYGLRCWDGMKKPLGPSGALEGCARTRPDGLPALGGYDEGHLHARHTTPARVRLSRAILAVSHPGSRIRHVDACACLLYTSD